MRFSIATVFLFASCLASAQIDEEVNSITIANLTGNQMTFLFASPSDSEYWGPDVLDASSVLDHGYELAFFVHYPDQCNQFDFLGIDANGTRYELGGQQICDGNPVTVTLTPAAATGQQSDFARMNIELQNLTDSTIAYLFVSPADSSMLGVDMLTAGSVLDRGRSLVLVVPREDRSVEYDVQAFGDDGSQYVFKIELSISGTDDTIRFLIENSDRVD